jgi:hypothetical protein
MKLVPAKGGSINLWLNRLDFRYENIIKLVA